MPESIFASRPIRSFVRREGRITDGQRRNLETLWKRYGLEIGATFFDCDAVFGRSAPLWLEIGFGNGEFLANLALAHPEVNLLGIEVHRPGVGNLLGRLAQNEITNVRVFCSDAWEVLRFGIADEMLERAYILFPDPWPKSKHHKRRLIQPDFVNLLALKFISGGQLHLATDWEDYALGMMKVFSAAPEWRNYAGPGIFSSRPSERIPTRFENRGLRLGHRVWELMFIADKIIII